MEPQTYPAEHADILERLTPAQREAVQHVDGPMLILAGPGSGKTRVVTHRIAYLLRQGVAPRQILALTFTNKAADEMKLRLELLAPGRPVWMGTFHGFCARLLRQYAGLVGLQENYSIYDTQDSTRALKQAMVDADVELTYSSVDAIASSISSAKGQQITPEQFVPRAGSAIGGLVERIYPAYQKRLLASNAVDFDDLLMHVATLLRENPELRSSLDERFRYIMVDEYQDTNLVQYVIARALSVDYPNLAVAGDPDQSIYGWRGANLSNILDFEHDYPHVRIVRLQQNYRSTPNILRVADQLIAHNVRRKEKVLLTDRPEGAPVRLVMYPTSRDEADDIAARIADAIYQGVRRPRDFAIFYRLNSLSRSLEDALRAHRIPYQIIKGLEFYQRQEIKYVFGYLHLLNNPSNDVACERIINTPPRKIGKKTVERLREHARRYGLSLLGAARESGLIESLGKQAPLAVAKFVSLYDRLRLDITRPLPELVEQVLDQSGYRESLERSGSDEDEQRLYNVNELITACREFHEQHPGEGLDEFLEQASLVSDIDAWETEIDRVTLMTLHSAKGLEFPVVFIVAVEDGVLPFVHSRDSERDEEEERRLLFVGITRAEEELQLSMAQRRALRGETRSMAGSAFLMELPRAEMQIVEPVQFDSTAGHHKHPDGDESDEDYEHAAWSDDEYLQDDPHDVTFDLPSAALRTAAEMLDDIASGVRKFPPQVFRRGMVVEHPEYGLGRIEALSGTGAKQNAAIYFFRSSLRKTFRLAHSPLVPVHSDE